MNQQKPDTKHNRKICKKSEWQKLKKDDDAAVDISWRFSYNFKLRTTRTMKFTVKGTQVNVCKQTLNNILMIFRFFFNIISFIFFA